MKSLPRLALGAFFAGMLAISTHATTQTCSTVSWNGPSGSISQTWNITVPSTVNISTSVTVTTYSSSGGGGGTGIYRSGTYVTGTGTGHPGVGTSSAGNSAYGQSAGNYMINHGLGGAPNTVYGQLYTTLTW